MIKAPELKIWGVFLYINISPKEGVPNVKTNPKTISKGGYQRIVTHKGIPDSLSTSTKNKFVLVLIFCFPSPYLSPSITGCLPAEREKLINIKTKLNIKEKED